jgi:hypothetical protein
MDHLRWKTTSWKVADDSGVDFSTHDTVVEYAVREMFKGKSPEAAAKRTAQKLSGAQNLFLGSDVVSIDPKKLEAALWNRMVENVISNIKRFKPGTENIALAATIQFFKQKKVVEEKLKTMVVKELGHDPFTK